MSPEAAPIGRQMTLTEFPKGLFHLVLQGHVLDCLAKLPSDSIDCVITSPPYWGLRDYKIEPTVWDGVEGCEHEWGEAVIERVDETGFQRNRVGLNKAAEAQDGNVRHATTDNPAVRRSSNYCERCGAWKGQLGLEPTFQLYVQHIVKVFHEVRRVLKPTGCLWLNLGDTYSGSPTGSYNGGGSAFVGRDTSGVASTVGNGVNKSESGLPQKCLIGIPYRVMLAMIDDGWILRNVNVWAKPNHMPSSVKDRFSNGWEPVFFFVKQGRYWFDLDAVREPHEGKDKSKAWWSAKPDKASGPMDRDGASQWERNGQLWEQNPLGKNPGDVWDDKQRNVIDPLTGEPKATYTGFNDRWAENGQNPAGKNPGDVWKITTQPFPDAHFATFPEALVERPLKASCPKSGIVLDPFAGAGTVAKVAKDNQRSSVSIEIKPEYVRMLKERIDFGHETIDNGIEWLSMNPTPKKSPHPTSAAKAGSKE